MLPRSVGGEWRLAHGGAWTLEAATSAGTRERDGRQGEGQSVGRRIRGPIAGPRPCETLVA
eukprot:5667548-Prymnesium_polylepis.1